MMDQKHSMMYPSLQGRGEAPSTSTHHDVPTLAPPSYDMAMASGPSPMNPQPSAPTPTTPSGLQAMHQFQPSGNVSSPMRGAPAPMANVTMGSYSNRVEPNSTRMNPVIVEPRGMEPLKLGPQPSTVTCPECGQRRKTRMHHTSSKRTHVFALILGCMGWCCCLCFIPYCMSSCKTGHHYCSKCNRFLGTYDRNGL